MQHSPATRSNVGPLGVPWWIVMIVCGLWVLSPIDPLPEFPLGCIGLVDDLGVACFGLYSLIRMLSGGGAAPSPEQVAMVQEPRTVTVEAMAVAPMLLTSPPAQVVREVSAVPPSDRRVCGVFIVQVIDDEGAVENIEIEARDAEHARATVAALGADGKIGKVRLKRMIGARESGGGSPEVGHEHHA